MTGGYATVSGNAEFGSVDMASGRLVGFAGSTMTSAQFLVRQGATFGSAGTVVGDVIVNGTALGLAASRFFCPWYVGMPLGLLASVHLGRPGRRRCGGGASRRDRECHRDRRRRNRAEPHRGTHHEPGTVGCTRLVAAQVLR